jgi:predicted nucleic acid-binding protein
VTLIVDAGPLYGQADARNPGHELIIRSLDAESGRLVVSPFAAAEADYLILGRLGVEVELAVLDDLASGTFHVPSLTVDELTSTKDVARQYRSLEIGLADASMVVLAARFRTTRILTFDERHFRAITPLQGGSFTLLPADEA